MPLHDPTGEGDWLSRSGGDPQTLSVDSEGNFRLGTDGDPCFDSGGNLLFTSCDWCLGDIDNTHVPRSISWRGMTFPLVSYTPGTQTYNYYKSLCSRMVWLTETIYRMESGVQRFHLDFDGGTWSVGYLEGTLWNLADGDTWINWYWVTRGIEWKCQGTPLSLSAYSAFVDYHLQEADPPFYTLLCESTDIPEIASTLPTFDELIVYGPTTYQVEDRTPTSYCSGDIACREYRTSIDGVWGDWDTTECAMRPDPSCWDWGDL